MVISLLKYRMYIVYTYKCNMQRRLLILQKDSTEHSSTEHTVDSFNNTAQSVEIRVTAFTEHGLFD